MTTYTHAGVSTLNGKIRVRFANDITRIKVLAANGHTNIDILPLIHPMTKAEAVDYLLANSFDNGNQQVRRALEEEQIKRGTAATTKTAAAEFA
jgi:hypothetical protein